MQKTRRKNLTPEEQQKHDANMVEAFDQFVPFDMSVGAGDGDGDYWLLQDFDDDALRAAWTDIAEQKEAKKKTGKSK